MLAIHTDAVRPQRSKDDGPGRTWGTFGYRMSHVKMLSSVAFLDWLRTPLPGRGDLLERGNGDGTRCERQLILSNDYLENFKGAAGYQPYLMNDVHAPVAIKDAILCIGGLCAGAAYGPDWKSRVGLMSVQITQMNALNHRGEHNDLPSQGEFIASYTAHGSGNVLIEYTSEETPPADAFTSRNRRPCMVRRQEAGDFYTMAGPSLHPAQHAVYAHDDGRVSLTYRFKLLSVTGWG